MDNRQQLQEEFLNEQRKTKVNNKSKGTHDMLKRRVLLSSPLILPSVHWSSKTTVADRKHIFHKGDTVKNEL